MLQRNSVTETGDLRDTAERDISRAHAPCSKGMSRCHGRDNTVTQSRDIRGSDSDRNPSRDSRHHHGRTEAGKGSGPKHLNDWLALQAADIIAQHEAGHFVDPAKLKLAREVLARAIPREPR